MDRFKSAFASRTIITNVVTLAASLAVLWGFELTMEQQATAVSVIVALGTAASSLFRVSATKQLVSSPEKAKEANASADLNTTIASNIGRKGPPGSLVVLLLLCLPLLGACQTAGQQVVSVTPTVTPTKIDVTLDNASREIQKYCAAIDMGLRLLDAYVVKEAKHRVIVQHAQVNFAAYCAAPPRDVQQALAFLSDTYGRILAIQQTRSARRQVAAARAVR
jgi:hypothetical protein